MTNQETSIENEIEEIENQEEDQENKNQDQEEENVIISKSKMILVKKLLFNVKENNEQLIKLLAAFVSPEDESRISIGQNMDEAFKSDDQTAENVIEGVFDGEYMIGPDGKQYSISANYASKSKLVEGDILKLTVTNNGTFIYKQIGPIERNRVIATLKRTGDNEFLALADGKTWRILNASVTYYKGEDGDEVIVLIPKSGESKWGAVENIIKKQ